MNEDKIIIDENKENIRYHHRKKRSKIAKKNFIRNTITCYCFLFSIRFLFKCLASWMGCFLSYSSCWINLGSFYQGRQSQICYNIYCYKHYRLFNIRFLFRCLASWMVDFLYCTNCWRFSRIKNIWYGLVTPKFLVKWAIDSVNIV